jgi:hypothetical protein
MAMVQTTINITNIAATPITVMIIVAILVCSNTFYFQEYLDNIIHLLLFTSIHVFFTHGHHQKTHGPQLRHGAMARAAAGSAALPPVGGRARPSSERCRPGWVAGILGAGGVI